MSTVSGTPSPVPPMSGSNEPPENLDDPDADVILCSRDSEHREFRVLKIFITKSSPVLRDLIQSAPSPHAPDSTSSLPSVQLSDSGATLYSLLTFILPVLPVLPSTHEQTMVLLSAAQKYQTDSVLNSIRTVLASQNPPFIRSETAFQAYSLARRYGLRQEALQAARATLTFQFTIEDLEDEFDAIHGIYLRELWTYYQSVRAHLRADLAGFRKTGMPVPAPSCGQNTRHGTPIWLDAYVGSIAESPALFDLTEFHMRLSLHISQNKGCRCSTMPGKAVRAFWTELTNVVHSCMTKVGLDGLRDCILNVSIGRVDYLAPRRTSNHVPCLLRGRLTNHTARSPGYIRCQYNNPIMRSCQLPCPQADVIHVIANF